MTAQEYFHRLAEKQNETTHSRMFGAECLKTENGKVAVIFWKDYLVVKLQATDANEALKIKGSQEFTPMQGRAMKGWYQIPFAAKDQWQKLMNQSVALVKTLPVNNSKIKK